MKKDRIFWKDFVKLELNAAVWRSASPLGAAAQKVRMKVEGCKQLMHVYMPSRLQVWFIFGWPISQSLRRIEGRQRLKCVNDHLVNSEPHKCQGYDVYHHQFGVIEDPKVCVCRISRLDEAVILNLCHRRCLRHWWQLKRMLWAWKILRTKDCAFSLSNQFTFYAAIELREHSGVEGKGEVDQVWRGRWWGWWGHDDEGLDVGTVMLDLKETDLWGILKAIT